MNKFLQIILILACNSMMHAGQKVNFSFEKKKLKDVVYEVAKLKGCNAIAPQIKQFQDLYDAQEVSYAPLEPIIEIDDAFNLTTTFLELSGFGWFKINDIYRVVPLGKKGSTSISREPLELFVNTPVKSIERTNKRIQYLLYLKNIMVAQYKQVITQLVSDMASEGAAPAIILPDINGIALVDRASHVASIVNLLTQIDKKGFREVIEVMPIFQMPAQDIATVLNSLKKASGQQFSPFQENVPPTSNASFAKDVHVIADNRRNVLIMMGRQADVNKIRDFISTNIDVPPQEGTSILHVYDLQYLNSTDFASVLQNIVSSKQQGGDFQSSQKLSYGPFQFFKGIAIAAEEITQIEQTSTTQAIEALNNPQNAGATPGQETLGIQGKSSIGGNRLIIAATESDWNAIKPVIEQLDKPQPQVIIESMIVEIGYDELKAVGSASRSLTPICDPNGFQFLSNNITNLSAVLGPNPTELAKDLLSVVGTGSVPNSVDSGSLLVSINDPRTPGIFALLQFLDNWFSTRIIQHPFIYVSNNQTAKIVSKIDKRARGDVAPGQNGSFVISIVDVVASIQLAVVPHISTDDTLKLDLAILIEDFLNDGSNSSESTSNLSSSNLGGNNNLNRAVRKITTTVNMRNDQVLAIGGLIRYADTELQSGTPILRSIPLIGSFFSRQQLDHQKRSIMVFIRPTIVNPKKAEPARLYAHGKMEDIRQNLHDSNLFGSPIDPVFRLFFKPSSKEGLDLIEEYKQSTGFFQNDTQSTQPQSYNFDKLQQKLAKESNPLAARNKE